MSQDVTIVGADPVDVLLAIRLDRAGKPLPSSRNIQKFTTACAVTLDAEVARTLASLGIDCDTDPAFENHKELYFWKNADFKDR